MAIVTMPQLGETVTEGTVGRWLKKEGEAVAKYEPLLEVETDKVASEIPSPFAGTLTKIVAAEGSTIPVGAPVCEISESGVEAKAAPNASTDRADRTRRARKPQRGALNIHPMARPTTIATHRPCASSRASTESICVSSPAAGAAVGSPPKM